MDYETKVFSSSIITKPENEFNHLYDLLTIIPALPIEDINKSTKNNVCSFTPKTDKYYMPKKKNGVKVKTVRDIRKKFEEDIYNYLPADLEKQKNYLLRKIRLGSAREEKTRETAMDMLKSSSPISRSSWQMLMNINPQGHRFPSQYVLWNGKYIQVNGSSGGNSKFIYKHDIGKIKDNCLNKSKIRKNVFAKKKRLLQNSLNVNFKPGPLTKKKDLDTSFQKYQFGEMKLVTLPKACIDIQPSYGKPIAPVINTFLQKAFLLNTNGVISENWANFAVSVLGTDIKGIPVQSTKSCNTTFDLDYKCCQRRILMRNDSEIVHQDADNTTHIQTQIKTEDETVILSEVINVVEKIIDSVEISLNQNDMFSGEDEPRNISTRNTSWCSNHNLRERQIKRKCGELDRLDVTVIRIPEKSELDTKILCHNAYCALGCICDSLKCSYNFKAHCGRIECMFQCKCDFTNYQLTDSFDNDSDIIPGLVNIEKHLGQTLAKEEHKFHQTVIVTDEKSVLLKSSRRNWKTSRKYSDFYCKMRLKSECVTKKVLQIACTNLKMKNVEPWCMVHNLYKCFCKGRFTEGSILQDETATSSNKEAEKSNKGIENISSLNDEIILKGIDKNKNIPKCVIDEREDYPVNSNECSRLHPYKGRKFTDGYYRITNMKISEMERNDKSLRKKLISLINNEEDCNISQIVPTPKNSLPSPSFNDVLSNVIDQINVEGSDVQRVSNKQLVTWLESSYQKYRAEIVEGLKKPSLPPPQPGTMALHSWEFILSRYRERKNHFLISKQQPFRIFMAINNKHSFFENCININDIALSDLDKYPVKIKKLLTNATDIKDNFCILYGLSHCWELVGTVTKVNKTDLSSDDDIDTVTIQKEQTPNDSGSNLEISPSVIDLSDELNSDTEHFSSVTEKNAEHSKWFVMTVENDFTEIQFYKKGFFVKYESVMKAIKVAKLSKKTVKLSSQNCANRQNSPNFGIYAIPSDKDNYVFIGPYEKDETLGIETIKSVPNTRRTKSTRGTWITTNKVDNLKVIDNPLLYMPSSNMNNKNIISEEFNSEKSHDVIYSQESVHKNPSTNISPEKTNIETITKKTKPIRIRKTNDFYQLAPNGLLRQIPMINKNNLKRSPSLLLNKSLVIRKNNFSLSSRLLNYTSMLPKTATLQGQGEKTEVLPGHKPVAEIAPQIKVCKKVNLSADIQNRKVERGMFVLKPEEINKRSVVNRLLHEEPQTSHEDAADSEKMDMDIENFLESSTVCTKPITEFYIISDDEDDDLRTVDKVDNKKERSLIDVYIVCKNNNIGWIRGMQNAENLLSFEFPGFKNSEFYKQEEAFNKITQVLSRKIYIPKHINLEWEVLKSLPTINPIKKLEQKDLCTDYVLTKHGLQHKFEMMKKISKMKKDLLKDFDSQDSTVNDNAGDEVENKTVIKDLEETSKTLEEESSFLWDKTISKKDELLQTFSQASEDLRKQLIEELTNIQSSSEDGLST